MNWDATQIAAVYVRDAVEQAPTNLVHGSDRDCLYQTMQGEEYVDDVDSGIVLKTSLFSVCKQSILSLPPQFQRLQVKREHYRTYNMSVL